MKTRVDVDEWWPVRFEAENGRTEIDVPAPTLKRWRRVFREFEDVQREIDEVVVKTIAEGGG